MIVQISDEPKHIWI